MTAQAIAQPRDGAVASGQRVTGGLLAIPGFLSMSISNGLVHSISLRMHAMIVGWLVLEMTGSKLWLGVVTGVPAIGIVACSLLGGALADSHDPRKLLIASRTLLAAVSFATAVMTTSGQLQLATLMLLVLVTTSVMATDMPVARMLMLNTVGAGRLVSAGAANLVTLNAFNIAGPLALGVIIGKAGPGPALFVLFGGYLAAMLLVLGLPRLDGHVTSRSASPLADIVAGFRYIRSVAVVRALVSLGLLVILAGVYFGMVPVYAREVLRVGPEGLGVLTASFAGGSLAGAVYMTARSSIKRRGLVVAALSLIFGAAMVAFALSSSLALSCAISLGMGVTAAFWQNLLGAMLQEAAAPEMRGRAIAVFTMAFHLASAGALIGGVVATLLSVQAAVALAGLAFAGLSLLIFASCRELRQID